MITLLFTIIFEARYILNLGRIWVMDILHIFSGPSFTSTVSMCLYLIFEKLSLKLFPKIKLGEFYFYVVYFELDFHCLYSLQKSSIVYCLWLYDTQLMNTFALFIFDRENKEEWFGMMYSLGAIRRLKIHPAKFDNFKDEKKTE